jgi:hypothetical protein
MSSLAHPRKSHNIDRLLLNDDRPYRIQKVLSDRSPPHKCQTMKRFKSLSFLIALRHSFSLNDISPLPPIFFSHHDFESHVGQTFSSFIEGSWPTFLDRLTILCSHFSSCPTVLPYSQMFCVHPLSHRLLSLFGECQDPEATQLLTELFINISAVDEYFVRSFLSDHFPKILSAHHQLSPRSSIVLLLAYNILSISGRWLLRDVSKIGGFLRQIISEFEFDPEQLSFSVPFLLISILRSVPLLQFEDHSSLSQILLRILTNCPLDRLELPLWAIYFWFRNNADSPVFWLSMNEDFVVNLLNYLSISVAAIRRLVLYIVAYLWLIPNDNLNVISVLESRFDVELVIELMADESPEIGVYADVLMGNFLGFREENVEKIIGEQPKLMKVLKWQLECGAVKVKAEAVFLLSVMLKRATEFVMEFVDEEVVGSLRGDRKSTRLNSSHS